MHAQHRDTMSSPRQGWRVLVRLAVLTAAAFALVAASVSAAPSSLKHSASASAPTATAAATKCAAQIQKGTKYVPVYERYYKYAFKKAKGSKSYKRVVVRARRKLMVSCARQCVRTKAKKGKQFPVYTTVRKKVTVKKGNRIVRVKKKIRAYVFQKCKNLGGAQSAGTPVKVTLLSGSQANLDFGAFQRQMPLSGTLQGFIPGGYILGQDNQIEFSRANITLGQTNVFIDDDCHGGTVSAAIRTGNPTTATLDPTKKSISTVMASGSVTASISTTIQLSLEMRNDDDGCDKPYITTGYTQFQKTFFLKGKIEKATGLTKLKLVSAPDPLDVQACLSPGLPTLPCNNDVLTIPLPIIVDLTTIVQVNIG